MQRERIMARGEEYKRQGWYLQAKNPNLGNFTEASASPTRQRAGSASGLCLKFSQNLDVRPCKYLSLLNPQLYFTLNLNINQSKVYQLKQPIWKIFCEVFMRKPNTKGRRVERVIWQGQKWYSSHGIIEKRVCHGIILKRRVKV